MPADSKLQSKLILIFGKELHAVAVMYVKFSLWTNPFIQQSQREASDLNDNYHKFPSIQTLWLQ